MPRRCPTAIALVLGLLAPAPLSGQYFGIQLGMNRTTFWSPDAPLVDPDPGYHFTGGLLLQISRLHSGLLYTPKSASMSQATPEGGTAVLGLEVDYLEVPLLVRYGYRRVEWPFGPVLGLRVDCSAEASISGIRQMSAEPPLSPCGDQVLRRLEAALGSPSRVGIAGAGATPGTRGEGVKTHSALCRTKPSARGVAPATTLAARSATGGLAAGPQDVAAPADKRRGGFESWEGRSVNRPPTSSSRRGAV